MVGGGGGRVMVQVGPAEYAGLSRASSSGLEWSVEPEKASKASIPFCYEESSEERPGSPKKPSPDILVVPVVRVPSIRIYGSAVFPATPQYLDEC